MTWTPSTPSLPPGSGRPTPTSARSTGSSPPPTPESSSATYTQTLRGDGLLVPPVSVECRPGNSECLADFTDGSALVFGQLPQLLDLAGTQGLGSAEQPAASARCR